MPRANTIRLSIDESLVLAGKAMPNIDGDPRALDELVKLGFQFSPSTTLLFTKIDSMPEGWHVEQLEGGLAAFCDKKGRQRLLIDPLGKVDRQGKPVIPPSTTIIPRLEGFVVTDLSYLFSNNQLVVIDHATGNMASSAPILVPIPLKEVFTFSACTDDVVGKTLLNLRRIHGELEAALRNLPIILKKSMTEAFLDKGQRPVDVPTDEFVDPFDIVYAEELFKYFSETANNGLSSISTLARIRYRDINKLEGNLTGGWRKTLEF